MNAKKRSTRLADDRRPTRIRTDERVVEREEGPVGWFLPQIESTYSLLAARDAALAPAGPVAGSFISIAQPAGAAPQLAAANPRTWIDRLREYKERKARAQPTPPAGLALGPAAPFVPGARNWLPLGPTVVLDGQTVGEEPVAGRIVGLAIAPGAQVIYAASAAGGVFRSDDGGTSWHSLMDGFDLDPTNFASASLACGAIAIDPGDPDRVYVGTGEGDTHVLFLHRVVNALPAYRGIGPISSVDGGLTWQSEPVAADSPELAGEAFFGLAVDSVTPESPVAATTAGLFQRRLHPAGHPEWVQRRTGVHSSVVVAAAGSTTRFFAAEWGNLVRYSRDGEVWRRAGDGFPTAGVGRIALAVQPDDPDTIYAMVVRESNGGLMGIYRLDGVTQDWRRIASPPKVLPLSNGSSQGAYDLAIAIDPNDRDQIYLGGSYAETPPSTFDWPWPASVWRARVTGSGAGLRFTDSRSIGTHAHADVHVLTHTPGDSDELWCGTDGGVFLNRDPRHSGEFAAQNTGLSCLCSNFISQHPTDPGILFTGLQDNGTAMTSGSPMWRHVNYGDGGYCLVNWNDPDRVLSFVNGRVFRSTTGGDTHTAWQPIWQFGWATMTQPIVGLPFDPTTPADADVVAVGAGDLVFVSTNFGSTWPLSGRIRLPGGSLAGRTFALAFATRDRLFIGTTIGGVFRADRNNGTWTVTRLDDVASGPLPVSGLIADVAADLGDLNGEAIYVAFAGMGERRRVWRYDGAAWEARSGPEGDGGLLDVEHNALAIDPASPDNVYAGADIGVWHSPDGGLTWAPFQNGLPDAPVFDLQIHPTQRLLRAATHGRGLYEIPLD